MAQGCVGILPEPLACCPQNSFGNAVDPNPATENCGAGYEPGSIWENSTDGKLFIMTTCPDTWVCFVGCDSGLADFKATIDPTPASLKTYPTGTTTIEWDSSPIYNLPAPGASWLGTSYPITENGIYVVYATLALDLRGLTIGATSDFVLDIVKNGSTIIERLQAVSIFNENGNEFLLTGGAKPVQLTSGDSLTVTLSHDAGVDVPGVTSATLPGYSVPEQLGSISISQRPS